MPMSLQHGLQRLVGDERGGGRAAGPSSRAAPRTPREKIAQHFPLWDMLNLKDAPEKTPAIKLFGGEDC